MTKTVGVVSGGPLTFAEAMALDPSEVQVKRPRDQEWASLATFENNTLRFLRECAFRRARPKRSLVQEMAEDYAGDHAVEHMTAAVRAVCAYLRKDADSTSLDCRTADDIERHFLEPR